MKAAWVLATALAGMAVTTHATPPTVDRILLCKTDDLDWGDLLEPKFRKSFVFRHHYSSDEDEHALGFPTHRISVLGAKLISVYTAHGEHEDSSSYAILEGSYSQFLARACAYYGRKPARAGRYRDEDGPAQQDRFLFKNDDVLVGARFAPLSKNRFTVRCRYDG